MHQQRLAETLDSAFLFLSLSNSTLLRFLKKTACFSGQRGSLIHPAIRWYHGFVPLEMHPKKAKKHGCIVRSGFGILGVQNVVRRRKGRKAMEFMCMNFLILVQYRYPNH
jgi:hypothetical protein